MGRVLGTILAGLLLLFTAIPAAAQDAPPYTSEDLEFESGGLILSGVIDGPSGQPARALIVFVHGYGNTDVRGWNMYWDLRERFSRLGIATVTWDKPGQGRSEGTFDADQPVEESAREVLDAITHFRAQQVPGSAKIGLWGISRAGWIVPMAMAQDPEIGFWISVSGVDDQENFLYLLQSNWRAEGRPEAEIELLSAQWLRGFAITSGGGTYADYLAATDRIRHDPLVLKFGGIAEPTEEQFLTQQRPFLSGELEIHPESGLMLYVDDFPAMLGGIDADVLALFGERDTNVDWRKTRALYEATIGANPDASLTVRSFPEANHNIDKAATGSIAEMEQMTERVKADGYYDAQVEWLKRYVVP
jgi:pimeloyl-ACP methyl ester carboxylesterase